MRRSIAVATLAALLLAAPALASDVPAPVVIEHVTVLPMTSGAKPAADVTVLIRDRRIEWIGPAAAATPPAGARRIDGRGKFLVPGFTDMHMHLQNDRLLRLWSGNKDIPDGTVNLEEALLPYVAQGVTQVFNLTSMSETVGQRLDVATSRILGPHIALAAMVDGSPSMMPVGITRVAATPQDARQIVRDAAAEGYEFIKVYSKLNLETFTALIDEARKQKLRVLGHIPAREQNLTEKFFQPGFDLVAHAEEFAQQTNPPAHDAIPRYVEMAKRSGTWLTATLTLDERLLEGMKNPASLAGRHDLRHLPPGEYQFAVYANPYHRGLDQGRIDYIQRIVDFNRELVRAFVAAGIPVLTGTDSPVPGVAPGFSLHDEFESLSRAGMSNLQVLEATTRLPAEWLGTIADRGTVEPGKRADLVLLDADPLQQIGHTRRIAAVIVNGRYVDRQELDRRLKVLSDRNPAR